MSRTRIFVRAHRGTVALAIAALAALAAVAAMGEVSGVVTEMAGFLLGALLTVVWLERSATRSRRARWRGVEEHATGQAVVDALAVFDALVEENLGTAVAANSVRFSSGAAISCSPVAALDEELIRSLREDLRLLTSYADPLWPLVYPWITGRDESATRPEGTVAWRGVRRVTDDAVDEAVAAFLSSRSVDLVVRLSDEPRLSLSALGALNAAESFVTASRAALRPRLLPEEPAFTDRAALRDAALDGIDAAAAGHHVDAVTRQVVIRFHDVVSRSASLAGQLTLLVEELRRNVRSV